MPRVAMIADNLNLNGISTVIVNYSNELSAHGYTVFVFAGDKIDDSFYNKEKYHFTIIRLPKRKKNPIKYYTELYMGLKKYKISIAHIHGNSAMITLELLICKVVGIENRIVHCHNTTCNHKMLHKLLLPSMNRLCTQRFACSDTAGKWLFGKRKYVVIPNGFQTEKFRYNKEERIRVRKELQCEDAFLIGHVGKFNTQKNHEYIIRVFDNIYTKNKRARLLLIGTGPKYEEMRGLVRKLQLDDVVIFKGEITDTAEYYSAMDAFMFPSLYEGLGIAVIEAQISGVVCYAADTVPAEVTVGDNIRFLSLKQGESSWAEQILQTKEIQRQNFYENNYARINKYNIKECSKILLNEYQKMVM